jgi:hypothetical protein
MSNALLKREVDALREVMMELAQASLRSDLSIARLSQEMLAFKDETREETRAFKEEMRAFKDETREETRAFKEEMRAFKDEMRVFKDETREETRAFKEEMRVFRDEAVRDRQRMNKQWGDLANKMGTLVEDIVAPNLPRVAGELLGCERPDLFAVRVVRHLGAETREYDALLVCPDTVLVNETKSTLHASHVEAFQVKLEELPQIFPEYAGRRVVGVLASLAVDDGVVAQATRRGIAVMAMGEDTMQVINPEAVRPRA